MIAGYCRVSTDEQGASGLGLESQAAALRAWAGDRPVEIVSEVATGSRQDRPVLGALLDRLEAGDVLAVAKLDRLSRTTRHVLDLAATLDKRRVGLVALDIGIDTTTPMGELVLTMMAALAQWERRIIGERTSAALQVLSREGRLARPERSVDPAVMDEIVRLRHGGMTLGEIARKLEADGVPTAQGGRWAHGTVSYLLDKHTCGTEAKIAH